MGIEGQMGTQDNDSDWACKIDDSKSIGYGTNNNINSKVKN